DVASRCGLLATQCERGRISGQCSGVLISCLSVTSMKMQPQLLRRLAGFDVMAHVLGTLGLRSQLFCRTECVSPWTVAFAASQLSHCDVVERGPVWLQIGQQSPVALAQGDLLFVARGQAYRLVDRADRRDGPVIEITDNDVPGQRILLRQGRKRAQ